MKLLPRLPFSDQLLKLPRLLLGARRCTLPEDFGTTRVLRPTHFGDLREVAGRRPVQDLVETLRRMGGRVVDVLDGCGAAALCSPVTGEGRSLLAVNLATVLANDLQQPVVLIDLDLRRPRLHDLLGVADGEGFTDVRPVHYVEDLLVPTAHDNLRLLRAGTTVADPMPLLHDGRLERLLAELRHLGAITLIDTPPALDFHDARLVGERVDAVLTVTRLGRSRRSELSRYYRNLDGVPFRGVLCNDDEDWIPSWIARFL